MAVFKNKLNQPLVVDLGGNYVYSVAAKGRFEIPDILAGSSLIVSLLAKNQVVRIDVASKEEKNIVAVNDAAVVTEKQEQPITEKIVLSSDNTPTLNLTGAIKEEDELENEEESDQEDLDSDKESSDQNNFFSKKFRKNKRF